MASQLASYRDDRRQALTLGAAGDKLAAPFAPEISAPLARFSIGATGGGKPGSGHRLDLMQDRLRRPLRGGAVLGLHHADPLA